MNRAGAALTAQGGSSTLPALEPAKPAWTVGARREKIRMI